MTWRAARVGPAVPRCWRVLALLGLVAGCTADAAQPRTDGVPPPARRAASAYVLPACPRLPAGEAGRTAACPTCGCPASAAARRCASRTCAARRRCSTCGPPGARSATRRCRCSRPGCARAGDRVRFFGVHYKAAGEVRRAVRRGLRGAVPVGARRGRRPGHRAALRGRRAAADLLRDRRRHGRRPQDRRDPVAGGARPRWSQRTSGCGCDGRGRAVRPSRRTTGCRSGCARSRTPRCTCGPRS